MIQPILWSLRNGLTDLNYLEVLSNKTLHAPNKLDLVLLS